MKKKADSKTRTPEAELRTYIEKFGPEAQKVIRSIRSALRKLFPTANELAYDYGKFFVISYSPTENGIDSVVSFAARPDGMRLYFTKGPKLPDPKRLLLGSGKETRYVPLESARTLSHPDVKAFIAATLGLAKIPLPAKGKGSVGIRGRGAK